MADRSGVTWTQARWNVVAGCDPTMPCAPRCWAAKMATRLAANPAVPRYRGLAAGGRWTGKARFFPELLAQPFHWRDPTTAAVALMGDLFHRDITDGQIAAVFGVMAASPRHRFQLLTKQAERMERWFLWAKQAWDPAGHCREIAESALPPLHVRDFGPAWPLGNVLLGVSVTCRADLWRLDYLRRCAAAVRWVSVEPLVADPGRPDLTGIDWCVAGCESGAGARPMEVVWVRQLREACAAAGTRFWFKQAMVGGKLVHAPLLDGVAHQAVPPVLEP